MPNVYDIRVSRSRFADFASGIRRCDFLPDQGMAVGDTLQYREFDYLEYYYTGRRLSFRVQAADRGPSLGIPNGYVMLSLDACVGGVTCRDLANAYETIRLQSLEPDCEQYVMRVLQSGQDAVHVLGTVVRISDAVFSRLIPHGGVVRWFNLVSGPAGGSRVAEAELGALNVVLESLGQYEPRGDDAHWVERRPTDD